MLNRPGTSGKSISLIIHVPGPIPMLESKVTSKNISSVKCCLVFCLLSVVVIDAGKGVSPL